MLASRLASRLAFRLDFSFAFRFAHPDTMRPRVFEIPTTESNRAPWLRISSCDADCVNYKRVQLISN